MITDCCLPTQHAHTPGSLSLALFQRKSMLVICPSTQHQTAIPPYDITPHPSKPQVGRYAQLVSLYIFIFMSFDEFRKRAMAGDHAPHIQYYSIIKTRWQTPTPARCAPQPLSLCPYRRLVIKKMRRGGNSGRVVPHSTVRFGAVVTGCVLGEFRAMRRVRSGCCHRRVYSVGGMTGVIWCRVGRSPRWWVWTNVTTLGWRLGQKKGGRPCRRTRSKLRKTSFRVSKFRRVCPRSF